MAPSRYVRWVLRPNNSFKPKPLRGFGSLFPQLWRGGVFTSTLRFGLTQALGLLQVKILVCGVGGALNVRLHR